MKEENKTKAERKKAKNPTELIMEYFKKDKRLDFRLEKLG